MDGWTDRYLCVLCYVVLCYVMMLCYVILYYIIVYYICLALMKALKKQTDVLELLGGKKKLVEDVTSSKMEGSDEFLQAVKDSDVEKLKKVLDKFPKLVSNR